MGVFAEIAADLPDECLHDNLIFKYLISKEIEESTATPTHEFYKFMHDLIPDIPPRRKLMYHMYVSENKETYHHFSRTARNWNLIMDLHNYFIRHNGDIYGMRASFFTIMATYCTYIMDKEECKSFLSDYADDVFQNELEEIVRYIYQNLSEGTRYTYRYEKIAKILNFTEEDIRMSYCSFSPERREEATRARKKRHAEKKKAETRYKKQDRMRYVREHFELSNAELAEACSVSERTISRIRATIREQDVT